MTNKAGQHETVLLDEAVDVLVTDEAGCYIDATFGRGGHSRKILQGLSEAGSLIGVDKDPVAYAEGVRLSKQNSAFTMKRGSFAMIDQYLAEQGMGQVSGIMADLGVSSPQIDDAERGFSFINDGPLDMRMDPESGISAQEWLAAAEVGEIAHVLKVYGEERFAKRIARAIVDAREAGPLETTLQLAQVVSEANPAWEKHKHPATRAFQAIRIQINNELGDLERFLEVAPQMLALGGRLVVISFHSLEDRMVKRAMKKLSKGNEPPPGVPVQEKDISRPFRVFSKAIKPSSGEVERNVRSRSAVMRILERVSND